MKKYNFLFITFLIVLTIRVSISESFAQNITITPNSITPNNGILRLSYDAIKLLTSPSEGTLVFDTTFGRMRMFTNGEWAAILTSKDYALTQPLLTAWKVGGNTLANTGNALAIDNNGNVYVTGYFVGTITIGTYTFSSTDYDVYVAKYNSSGVLQWAKKASAGGSNKEEGRGISVDANGNVFVTGYFQGTINFDGTSLTSSGGTDIFLAKYDASGSLLWVQKAGGVHNDVGEAIKIDNSGNIYIVGYFREVATFSTVGITSAGVEDVFLAKYDQTGTLVNLIRAGGASSDVALGMEIDGSGNLYIVGNYYDSATFGNYTINSQGGSDIFLVKYNSSGSAVWAKTAGSGGGGAVTDVGKGVTVDASGSVYITGSFQGTATFGTLSITATGPSPYEDIFVAKYSSSGTCDWVQNAGNNIQDTGNGLAIDADGNVFITGNYSGLSKIYLAKLNNLGQFQWSKLLGGSGENSGKAIAIKNGEIFITGIFSNTAVFGNTTLSALTAGFNNYPDVFITRIREN